MKHRLLLVVLLLGLARVASAADVSVADSPGWQPASEEQMKMVKASEGYDVVDFSIRATGGAGIVLRTHTTGVVDKKFYEESLQGFLHPLNAAGYTVREQHPAPLGHLQGVCFTLDGSPGGNPITVVAYLGFSKAELYTVSVYGPQGMNADDPLVAEYLARVAFDPTVAAAEIDKLSDFNRGREIGKSIGKFVTIGAVVCAVIGLIVLVVIRVSRKKPGPPPLPTASGG